MAGSHRTIPITERCAPISDGLRVPGCRVDGWEARHAFLEQNVGHLNDWIIERLSPAAGQVILEVGAGPADLGRRMAAAPRRVHHLVAFSHDAEVTTEVVGAKSSSGQMSPRASMARATRWKPAMFAPLTRLPGTPYSSAVSLHWL